MSQKVWFITGASRGFGRIWAEAALERGDLVAATARKVEDLAELSSRFGDRVLPLTLDVTDSEQVRTAVQAAHRQFGRLDVVLNNAGYSLVGAVEEVDEKDVQQLFNTNLLGTLRVIQAVLPILRQQGKGHILGVSSGLGLISFPFLSLYSSSKWAFESLHEALAQEIKPFGLTVTIIEPGAYATEFGSPTSLKMAETLEPYAGAKKQLFAHISTMQQGDPHATADAILTIVDTPEPPLRFILGNSNLPYVRKAYEGRLAVWEQWADLSNSAQGAPTKTEFSL